LAEKGKKKEKNPGRCCCKIASGLDLFARHRILQPAANEKKRGGWNEKSCVEWLLRNNWVWKDEAQGRKIFIFFLFLWLCLLLLCDDVNALFGIFSAGFLDSFLAGWIWICWGRRES